MASMGLVVVTSNTQREREIYQISYAGNVNENRPAAALAHSGFAPRMII